jgi:hypothetical protein
MFNRKLLANTEDRGLGHWLEGLEAPMGGLDGAVWSGNATMTQLPSVTWYARKIDQPCATRVAPR